MSQQQPRLLATDRQAIEELLEEIDFQNVLLASIDDSVQDREAAEKEVKDEIKALKRKVFKLKRGATTALPTHHSGLLAPTSSLSYPPESSTSTETSSAVAMDSSSGRRPWNAMASYSSTGSTPNSGDASDLLSPSPINLPTRKRSYSKHLDRAYPSFEDNKSRRTSPSPYLIDPTTPSSMISSGDDDFPEFETRFFTQRQKEMEEKIKQEKRDEEIARTIQQELSVPMRPPPGPSAFDMIRGANRSQLTSMSSSESAQRHHLSRSTLPWPSTSSASSFRVEPNIETPNFKHEEASTQNPNQHRFKIERSPARHMPGAFGNDFSDSNDSDIEIIPASAFHDNGRQSRQTARPNFSPEAQTAGQAALQRINQLQSTNDNSLHQNLFGRSSQVPAWMNENNDSSSLYGDMHENGSSIMDPFNSMMGSNQAYPRTYPNSGLSNGYAGYKQFNSGAGMYWNGSSGSLTGAGSGLGYILDTTTPNSFPHSSGSLSDNIRHSDTDIFDELSDYPNVGEDSIGQADYTINDPRKTTQEIKDLLENIRPDAELPPEHREGTPEGLVHPLFEHQKLALTWLKTMEESTNKGGILADDMGLGKTISTLALMLSRPSLDRGRKTTLIVGPVALIRQWKDELENKITRKHSLSIHMVHGPGKKLSWDELKHYDVILTTYGTLSSEWRRYEKWMIQQKDIANGGEYDTGPCNKLFPMLGPRSLFYRVVLDEAQSIKNRTTISAQACCRLKAIYRLCLSGTPMMNGVSELYSLIHFLRIKPYNDYKRFQEEFGMLTKGNYSKQRVDSAMRKFQVMLKAILLRRTKTSLIDGKPIINLPPKTEEVQHVVFDEDEQAFYAALESKTQIQFNKYVKNGTAGKNYSNILVLLLRLRQACCHPHLLHDFQESPTDADPSSEGMMDLARNLTPDVVARLLAQEAFECPVCYDAVLNPRIITPCGHDTCAECLTKISDQTAQQNLRDGNDDNRGLKCPSCRGDLVLSKVIDYTTFKTVHNPEPVEDDSAAEDSSDDETESESVDNPDSDGDIRDFIVPDDVATEDESTEGEDGDDEADESKTRSKKPDRRRQKSNTSGKMKEKKPHLSLAMLKKEANKNATNHKRYLKYLKRHWQPSAKITKCVELLDTFLNDGQKTIIFSQFVSLLDLLEVPINEKNWQCLRYDGSKSADARNEAVRKFKFSATHNIMLISLKAGNAGLNLTAATRVIILDPFWNPFIEMQAVDRAYRMGQQNPVQVHRILIERTVEDRIIELQEQKRQLVNAALDEGANKDIGRLDLGQLAFLFGVGQR